MKINFMDKVVYREEVYTVIGQYFDQLFIVTYIIITKNDVKITVPKSEVVFI